MLLPTRLRLPRLGRPTPRLARRLTNRGVVDLRVPGNADTAEAASRCPPPWIQLEKCGHASAAAHRYRAALPVVHYPRNERNNSEIEGSGVRSLQQNQRVQFEIARGAKGPQAVGVNRREIPSLRSTVRRRFGRSARSMMDPTVPSAAVSGVILFASWVRRVPPLRLPSAIAQTVDGSVTVGAGLFPSFKHGPISAV